jgi:glutamate synthase (NADPH) small chain
MNAAIGKGDFALAAKVLRKKVPFPGIISHICDHPCEDVCRRKAVDEAISIRELEKAAMVHARSSEERLMLLKGKGKRVAVVGIGLSGLTACLDLAKKGLGPVLFEASDRLGGTLWDFPEAELPRDVLGRDLELMGKLSVEIRFRTVVGSDVSLSELKAEFDAVYLGIGNNARAVGEIELDNEGRIIVDPVTFQTSVEGVFAGGSALWGSTGRSPIRSISEGRRATISIDRYLQKVSLVASRENEGSFETRLFTSVEGVEPEGRIPAGDPVAGYSPEDAVREGGRCLQCECLECVKVCQYLADFKGYPKKYVRQIYNNLSIVAGNRHANLLINSCSLCGLCKEVCPEDLHMGEVCKTARRLMVSQKRMPPSAHEFALQDMAFSNSDICVLARHEPGKTASAHLFFPGCQLAGSAPEHVTKTYAYLKDKIPEGVALMLRCCGAPADWSGRQDLFDVTISAFREQWSELGSPTIITACSTCHAVFSEQIGQGKVVSLWETIDRLGLPEGAPNANPNPIAVHDPCTARNEPRILDGVRNILDKLGYNVHELPLSRDKTECCGFGGLMSFANRDLAEKVVDRRIAETPEPMLAYCAVCRDRFASHGKPTWHLLDLLFGSGDSGESVVKGPDYSQRRENRARLKRSLLREVWNEENVGFEKAKTVTLHISDDVRALMDKRMILVEDVREVVEWAEKTGNRLVNRTTKHLLTHYRPGTVTFWVEYSPADEGYAIHNVYCHRMQVLEEIKR